jgi:formylglycine-generating enzyme required for sulfatase activity
MALIFLFLLQFSSHSAAQTVAVPGGELNPFWIVPKEGEAPARIKIAAFRALATPVTNGEFLVFLRKNPQWRKGKVPRIFADPGYLADFTSELNLKKGVRGDSPVAHVSYFAAQAYCESLAMHLPSTAQWEYMGAASETKADASADPAFLERILDWYAEPKSDAGLPQVKRRAPNFYGIYDLHGLVWEWVEDFNSNFFTGESREDGSLNRNLFCGAGGMAGGNKENYAAFMRFAFRSSLKGRSTAWNLGFRCVKEGT